MTRRAPSNFADYLVVAISPALIMLLVGSLMFFLIEVFYQGQYPLRLQFVMAMFVMAIVCIARISMEEGSGYAALFGAPLGAVTALALFRFVRIEGPLAAVSLPINLGLMALVWWAAHKLTWDCTLIDDSVDASGQGLLQEMGLDPNGAGGGPRGPAGTSMPAQPEATSSISQPAELPWWQRLFEADRRPHAPGVWVVYFSLAALPLFGIGGWFIPASATDVRQRAMLFLVVYVASGLTLLVTTSFLGLRRYLRQRWLEMPLEMAATWVGLGLAMIAGTLAICYLLPRPDSLRLIAQPPISFTSPDRQANRVAVGPEGAQRPAGQQSTTAAKPQPGQTGQQEGSTGESGQQNASNRGDKTGQGQQSPTNQGQQSDSKSQGSSGSQGQGKDAANAQSQNGSGKQKNGQQAKGSDGAGKSKADGAGQKSESASKSGSQTKSAEDAAGGKSKSSDRTNEQQKASSSSSPSQEQTQQQKSTQSPSAKSSESQAAQNQPPPSSPPPTSLNVDWGGVLPWVLRVLFFAALAIVAVWLAWRYRTELAAAWQKLLAELRELWERLTGSRNSAAVTAAASAPTGPVYRSFASFADPFQTGAAARMSWPQLVHYTFQALEAWGRENGRPRTSGQTPHEYAITLANQQPQLRRQLSALADAYGQIAYAPPHPSAVAVEPLSELWQHMRAAPANVVA